MATPITKTTGLVFIGGSGLDEWIWQAVTTNLSQPSMVLHFSKAPDSAGMADYVAQATQQLEAFKADQLVIVGHSLGGTIGLSVAQAIGDRLAGFVGVSAFIPKNSGSFFSALPVPQRYIMPIIVRLAGTKPPESAILKGYCNDLPQQQTQEVLAKYRPDTRQIFADKSAPVPQNVPKLYIKTTDDKELPAKVQDTMASNLGADSIVQIATGHLPMLSKPQELATIISNFVSKNVG